MTIETTDSSDSAPLSEREALTFNTDTDICVIGGGLAGLTMALESAKKGASVVVLEGRRVGWNASGHNMGSVMPGYGVPVDDLIERVGFDDTRELWALAQEGADYMRRKAGEIGNVDLTDGALEVSTVDAGDKLIHRLQLLGSDFGTDLEGWQVERVREVLKTRRYFHGIHYPKAFQLDGAKYVHGLARLAEAAGVRIFENTPAVSMDPNGIRKRIVTPSARLRASHIVLAGNIHIGAPAMRLAGTLLPVWRYAGITEPLGERLAEVIAFQGSVADADGIDHFRIVNGDRLMWSNPETTWNARPQKFARAIERRIRTIFPGLGDVAVESMWSGAFGRTVHGMPQIGRLRPGLWVVSGFGRQGLNTSAMGGDLISRSILWGDDRWKLFAPFELVWAGGTGGRVVGQVMGTLSRGASAATGTLARWREQLQKREQAREKSREARAASAKARSVQAMQAARARRAQTEARQRNRGGGDAA
ncbi:MAG: FAD-binding oxidoreductase [Bradyrhizobiaceae bacterium]|nr:MAG: FAD-binding oxidoreductase [Bradyrhizobiaceae bacterium]